MSFASKIDVTAIIVNYNTVGLLQPCVSALRKAAGALTLQIVIVDNGSRDGSVALLRERFADCELILNEVNVGFGRANNQALPLVRGERVLLLNTDACIEGEGLVAAVRFLDAHPACALVGARLIGRDGVLQPSCRYFPTPWNEFLVRTGLARLSPHTPLVDDMAWDHASARECDWVPGCFYLLRKSVLDAVGLFDPRFFLYFEEVDHCRAVKAAGWQVQFYPGTTVVHLGGESAKSDSKLTASGKQISALQIESSLLYYRKHHGRLGLLLALLLGSLGDAILAAKWLLRRRPLRGLGDFWRHSMTTWSLLRRTGGGLRPTR